LLVKQFDAFEPIPGMRINGTLTLGENLADLGGLVIAYDAFTHAQQGQPTPAPQDGFTPAQRFFLSYAETWRFKLREETLRARLLTDEHAPPKYRVLGRWRTCRRSPPRSTARRGCDGASRHEPAEQLVDPGRIRLSGAVTVRDRAFEARTKGHPPWPRK
jgi:hypothetical protein